MANTHTSKAALQRENIPSQNYYLKKYQITLTLKQEKNQTDSTEAFHKPLCISMLFIEE